MFSKKNIRDISIEETPHALGSRKLIVSKNDTTSSFFEALTYGYLPANEKWTFHKHINIVEICIVIKGNGLVKNAEGKSEKFEPGDRLIFPSDTEHEIQNTSTETAEFYFFRLQNK